jgi:predicted Zn finger-like uncharacterized protein
VSQMVTTCPNCRQQLAVTPADLRVGQGFVRCGRCDKVFNALLTLTEDAPAPDEPDAVAHGTASVPMLDEQDALPPLPGRETEPGEFGAVEEVEVVETRVSGQYRSLELEADAAGPDEAPARDEDIARDIIRQATSQPIDILLADDDPDTAQPTPEAPAAVRSEPAMNTATAAQEAEFDADEAVGNRRRARVGWYVAALLLLLTLAAQYLHHNRHTLVLVPWLEQPIQSVYGRIGQQVEPVWSLDHYELSELGGMELTGDARTLVLQAAVAVRKEAPWGQPPPVLRAVLSDRYGNVLATHELAPSAWLLGEAPPRIAPGQRLDARLAMPDPAGVMGFALHACLPDSGGALHCTDDPRP